MRLRFSPYKLVIALVTVSFIGCTSSNEILNDCFSLNQYRKSALPSFQYYVMNVLSEGKSRVDVYLQMPYKNIRFEKSADGFHAAYTVSLIFKNAEGEIIQSKEIDRTVDVKHYAETVSAKSDFFMQSFLVNPGMYAMEIVSRDNLSRLSYREKKKIEAKNFLDSTFSASTMLFLDTILVHNGTISLRPIMPASIAQLENSLGIFQEVYNVHIGDTIQTSLEYLFPKKNIIEQQQFSYYMVPPYKITTTACMREYDSVGYRRDSLVIAKKSGTMQFFQTYPLQFAGYAVIRRNVERRNHGKAESIQHTYSIFRRESKYRKILSPEEILFAMRFILRPVEYDSISQCTGPAQLEKIASFWEVRGGKQRRLDFEKRIAEANALFTSCVEGGKTPMGITYIVCGAPDYVECRSFSEYWFYNLGERVYSIEFRSDRDGQPRYFELAPFSVNENFWQYFVERWRRK